MRLQSTATVLIAAGLLATARAGAADVGPTGGGVLDGLNVPAVPAGDGRAACLTPSADPIAVPTPSAAGSGLVLMAAVAGWRYTRRPAVRP